MTDTQRLKDKLTDLRLKGMLQHLDTTLEQAAQKNLNVVATLTLLADLELEHRWHNRASDYLALLARLADEGL